MIQWIIRRIAARTERQATAILAALADGAPHYIVGDLDRKTGINAGSIHPALARLERTGRIETGIADLGPHRPPRRWYRLAEDVNA